MSYTAIAEAAAVMVKINLLFFEVRDFFLRADRPAAPRLMRRTEGRIL